MTELPTGSRGLEKQVSVNSAVTTPSGPFLSWSPFLPCHPDSPPGAPAVGPHPSGWMVARASGDGGTGSEAELGCGSPNQMQTLASDHAPALVKTVEREEK